MIFLTERVIRLKGFVDGGNMKIIAHRGASFYSPENTMSAFKLAETFNVDGIEMDIHMTRDKKLVVIHDKTTGRTGTDNFEVKTSTFSKLKKIDVGSWFGDSFNGEKIPLLLDVVENISEKLEFYIEIKTGTEIIDTFCEFLDKNKAVKNNITVISFNYDTVSELKKVRPDIKALWIVQYGYNVQVEKNMYKKVFKKIENASLNGISTHSELEHCIKMAKTIKESNLIWNVWTVDNPFLAKKMLSLGVSSLTTNRPDWIMQHLFNVD